MASICLLNTCPSFQNGNNYRHSANKNSIKSGRSSEQIDVLIFFKTAANVGSQHLVCFEFSHNTKMAYYILR